MKTMETREYKIYCARDKEAGVWYVVESDVPGLSIEAPTQKAMIARIRVIVPELLQLNSELGSGNFEKAPVELLWANRSQRLRISGA